MDETDEKPIRQEPDGLLRYLWLWVIAVVVVYVLVQSYLFFKLHPNFPDF